MLEIHDEEKKLPGQFLVISGIIFILISIVCFTAWNWRALGAIEKFGLDAVIFSICVFSAMACKKWRAMALFCAAASLGLFWASFGQVFQQASSLENFAAAWALCVIPVFLADRNSAVWNLLCLLVITAISDLNGSTFAILSVSGILTVIALYFSEKPSWTLIPLSAMFIAANAAVLRLVFETFKPDYLWGIAAFAFLAWLNARKQIKVARIGMLLSGLVIFNALCGKALIFMEFGVIFITGFMAFLNIAIAWLTLRHLSENKTIIKICGFAATVFLALFICAMSATIGAGLETLIAAIILIVAGIIIETRGEYKVSAAIFSGIFVISGFFALDAAFFDLIDEASIFDNAFMFGLFQIVAAAPVWLIAKKTRPILVSYTPAAIMAVCLISNDVFVINCILLCCIACVFAKKFGREPIHTLPLIVALPFLSGLTQLVGRPEIIYMYPAYSGVAFYAFACMAVKETRMHLVPALLLGGVMAIALPAASMLSICLAFAGFQRGNRIFTFFGAISFVLSILSFYYTTDLSFPEKALRMGILGSAMLIPGLFVLKIVPQKPCFQGSVNLALAVLAILVICLGSIIEKERILFYGEKVIFEITPRDPRDFMLGDYMNLSYKIDPSYGTRKNGYARLETDQDGFVIRVTGPFNECGNKICVKIKDGKLLLPRKFYFEEGMEEEKSGYAIMRCLKGTCLVTGLKN